jgi:hypothetical protein
LEEVIYLGVSNVKILQHLHWDANPAAWQKAFRLGLGEEWRLTPTPNSRTLPWKLGRVPLDPHSPPWFFSMVS